MEMVEVGQVRMLASLHGGRQTTHGKVGRPVAEEKEKEAKAKGGKGAGSDTTAVASREVPEWLQFLPSAESLLRDVGLAVEGRMFLEVFAGC